MWAKHKELRVFPAILHLFGKSLPSIVRARPSDATSLELSHGINLSGPAQNPADW